MMKEYQLTRDAVSLIKKRVYGKAGDTVKIIHKNGNVMIVEGQDGERFPVTAEDIKEKIK